MLSRCDGSRVSRASFRSIRHSATCAGVTVIRAPATSARRWREALRRPVDRAPVLDHAGGVLQQHGAVHRTAPIPWAIAQFSSASASASLSSAGCEAEPADGLDHRLLVGVALAGDVPLDRADGDALVRDAVRLGPGGEMREVASVGVARRRCPRCRRTSSNTTTPTPPDVSSISCSQARKRSQIMPPPSNRPGRNSWTPLAMAPSRLRTAQPVRWPRSRARITGACGGGAAIASGASVSVIGRIFAIACQTQHDRRLGRRRLPDRNDLAGLDQHRQRRCSDAYDRRTAFVAMTSALVSPASPAFPMIVSRQVSSGSRDIGGCPRSSPRPTSPPGSAALTEQRIDFSFISSSRVMERRGRRRCPVRDDGPAPALEGGCGQRR